VNWLKDHLVADWKLALQWSSVRLNIAASVLALIYAAMPVLDPTIAAMLPARLQTEAIGAYAIIGLVLRVSKLKSNG